MVTGLIRKNCSLSVPRARRWYTNVTYFYYNYITIFLGECDSICCNIFSTLGQQLARIYNYPFISTIQWQIGISVIQINHVKMWMVCLGFEPWGAEDKGWNEQMNQFSTCYISFPIKKICFRTSYLVWSKFVWGTW